MATLRLVHSYITTFGCIIAFKKRVVSDKRRRLSDTFISDSWKDSVRDGRRQRTLWFRISPAREHAEMLLGPSDHHSVAVKEFKNDLSREVCKFYSNLSVILNAYNRFIFDKHNNFCLVRYFYSFFLK